MARCAKLGRSQQRPTLQFQLLSSSSRSPNLMSWAVAIGPRTREAGAGRVPGPGPPVHLGLYHKIINEETNWEAAMDFHFFYMFSTLWGIYVAVLQCGVKKPPIEGKNRNSVPLLWPRGGNKAHVTQYYYYLLFMWALKFGNNYTYKTTNLFKVQPWFWWLIVAEYHRKCRNNRTTVVSSVLTYLIFVTQACEVLCVNKIV